jgi:hypothetical protein
VSRATVLSRLHNSLGTQNFHLRWVPHQLTDRLPQVRVAKCGELLHALEVMQRNLFCQLITGDESWFYLQSQHASQRSVSRDEVPQGADPDIGTAKFILTAIWGVNGFHLLDSMPSECRFNAQYFMEHVMAPLAQTVFPQGRTRYIPRLNITLDNCRVHFSKLAEQFSSRISFCMFPTHLIVPASGYSRVPRLDSLPKFRRAPKITRSCLRISGGNCFCGIDGGFRGLG